MKTKTVRKIYGVYWYFSPEHCSGCHELVLDSFWSEPKDAQARAVDVRHYASDERLEWTKDLEDPAEPAAELWQAGSSRVEIRVLPLLKWSK